MAVWEQEFKDYRWLLHQLSLARKSGDEKKIAKRMQKFENWKKAHPDAFHEISEALLKHGANAPIQIKRGVKRRD